MAVFLFFRNRNYLCNKKRMGQPVRRNIQEAHPEINQKLTYTLLVDGGNILRMAMADTRINSSGVHYGGTFQFLLQLRIMLQKKSFDYVYVTFDDEDSGIMRYMIYQEYKANRDKHYGEHLEAKSDGLSAYGKAFEDKVKSMNNYFKRNKINRTTESKAASDKEKLVDENFARERAQLCMYFNEMFIRWIMDENGTEGDDIISYYVHHKREDERIVIMSGDEDLTQLISDTVCIYNPRLKKFVSHKNFRELKGFPHENVALRKVLMGDSSDNIKGINGLSESRLYELMPEIKERAVTLNEVIERAKHKCDERVAAKKKPLKWQENIVNGVHNGEYEGDFYDINRQIIDLRNPLLTPEAENEISEMMYNAMDPTDRSFENLYKMIEDDDITELRGQGRFASFFEPFKILADKEKRRFKDFCS